MTERLGAICGYRGYNFKHDKCVYCGLTAEAYYRLGLLECPRYFARDVGGPRNNDFERALAKIYSGPVGTVTKASAVEQNDLPVTRAGMKAADDFDAIRQRLAELQAEKRRCTGGCGEPLRGYHKEGCKYQGVVVEGETQ